MTTAPAGPLGRPGGDPGVVAAAAGQLADLAADLAAAVRVTGEVAGQGGWTGAAAEAFRAALAVHGDRARSLAGAVAGAAEALLRYAAELGGLQAEWDRTVAGGGPVVATGTLPVTAQRLRAEAGAAAGRAAARLDAAAAAVPRQQTGAGGLTDRLQEWQAEVALGAGESVVSLGVTAFRFRPGRWRSDPWGTAQDLGHQLTGLAGAARHPRRLAAQLLDLDTWRSAPARAVGHLLPDAVASVATGGTAAAGRRAAAAAARAGRSAELGAAAGAGRAGLVRTAAGRAGPLTGRWTGDGLELAPDAAARVAAYHRLVVGYEAGVTATMHRLAGRVGACLEGLEHRVKALPSLNRKVAELVGRHGGDPGTLLRVLEQQGDTLRYTMVLPQRGYAAGVRRAALELDRAGYASSGIRNWWADARYHGLNTTWTDPATGVRFEVQFHTPGTWAATVRTHPWYEEFRLPETGAERKAELAGRIGAEYAAAGVPRRAGGLTVQTLPPPEPIDLPVLPAAAAGAGTGVLTTAAREGATRAGLPARGTSPSAHRLWERRWRRVALGHRPG